MATFPDVTVAFTHRDPVSVIQSAITMMAYSDRLRRTSIDPQWLLDYWSDRVHRLLSTCVRDRDLVASERKNGPRCLHAGRQHFGLIGLVAASRNRTPVSGRVLLRQIGRQLEEGCFDLMFFDDRLAMPGVYGGSVDEAVHYGARPVKLDLGVILGVLAQATSKIGLGATYSRTYYQPFHVARTFASLDHLSGGRAAWNAVTSVNDCEAQNFGVDAHLGHDERYDRAGEFMDVVTGLWDTWEDDAILHDRASGHYANPARVHELGHVGQFFSARGPLAVPRTPQGRPVIIQAGSSGRGREFASRWAELIFTGDPGIDVARSHYADQKDRIADAGRDPAAARICPMAYAVVGESEAHAKEREAMFLDDLVHPLASPTLPSELMNYDFAQHDLDDPVTDELLASVSGIRGLVQNLRTHISSEGGGRPVTLRDLANHRATLLQGPRFVGTGEQVADQMADWFESGSCDGFVLAATHLPGAFEDVVRMVVPELQRRGLFRTGYESSTLRGHLGLQRPSNMRAAAGANA